MLIRTVALFALLVPGIGSQAVAAVPQPDLDGRLLRSAAVQAGRAGSQEAMAWLQEQSGVRWAGLGRDHQTIDIHFRDGTESVILPAAMGAVAVGSRSSGRLAQRTDTEVEPLPPMFHDQVRGSSPAGRALVLEPFATELGLGSNAGDPEVNALKSRGFSVSELYNGEVTVASMATLSRYNVVYMHTHSGANANGEGVVATGQLSNNDPSVAPEVQNGSVITVAVSGSNQLYYAITSTYIQTYVAPFPHDSIDFFNGCTLLGASLFWKALADKGLGVMVTWDQEASSRDNYLGAAAFFNEMATGMTVSAAIAAEQAAGYGKSTVNGQPAVLGFKGDGTITLDRSAGGQVAAPPPTPITVRPGVTPPPTPITVRPGVTPAPTVGQAQPTATAVPKAPLSATLRSPVNPGQLQVIHITSSPHTTVRVDVMFPDGSHRGTTVTTDVLGHAIFKYPQHPSKITYGNVFARVTLTAGSGPNPTSIEQTYRIGWGKLDIAVAPETVSVGGTVTIYVHTRARLRVTVVLQFPRGGSAKLSGATGARGWARFTYRIRRGQNLPASHVVTVRTTAAVHGHMYRATTRFTIQ